MEYNTVCHVEFDATDLVSAQKFYEGLFGWTFCPFGDEMLVFQSGERHLGGITKVDKVSNGSSPSVWFNVEDLDASLAKVEELGGNIHTAKSMLPDVGWTACALDLDGNEVGLVEFVKA